MAKFVQYLAGASDFIPDTPVREFKIPARTWKPSWRRDCRSKAFPVQPDSAPKTMEPTIASNGLVNMEKMPSHLVRKGYYVTITIQRPKTEKKSFWDFFGKKHLPARSQDSGKRGKFNLFGRLQSENEKHLPARSQDSGKRGKLNLFGHLLSQKEKHLPARSQDSGKRGKFNLFGRHQSIKEIHLPARSQDSGKRGKWNNFGRLQFKKEKHLPARSQDSGKRGKFNLFGRHQSIKEIHLPARSQDSGKRGKWNNFGRLQFKKEKHLPARSQDSGKRGKFNLFGRHQSIKEIHLPARSQDLGKRGKWNNFGRHQFKKEKHLPARSQDSGKRGKFNLFGRHQSIKEIHLPARSQDSGKRGKWNNFGRLQFKKEKHLPARSQDSGKRGKWDIFGRHQSKKEQYLAGASDFIPDTPVREFKIPARTWKPSWRRDCRSKAFPVQPDSAPKTMEPTIASNGLVNLEKMPSPLVRKGYYVTKHLPARSQDSGKRGKFNVFGRLQSEKEITTQRPKPEKKSFWDFFGKKSGSSKVQPLVPKYKSVGTQVSKEEFPEIPMASRSTIADPKIKVSMETQVEEQDFQNISEISFPCVKRQKKKSFLSPLETPTGDVFVSKPLPPISLIVIKEAKLDDRMAEY
ncbi:uncharacterized protein LOC142748833 isoform X2 [Rhinoderma darwinii]|uniref:uncharacterized protein LOC142748833 isoform X2 n=1 Tax=Rhinoderma darwinii TaxID=43563 RepID=UPI003F6766A9